MEVRSCQIAAAMAVVLLCLACTSEPTVVEPEEQAFVLHGRLRDPGGVPITAARVATARKSGEEAVSVSEVDADGSYRLEFTGQGYLEARFQAVDREDRIARLWVESEDRIELRLDACLSPFPATEDVKAASVVGDFNDFDRATGVPLEEQEDGSWLASIETSQSEIEYQINGLSEFGATYHGSDVESLRYRSDHSWVGVAAVIDGKAQVRLDVPEWKDEPCPETLQFRPADAEPAKIALALERIDQAQLDWIREYRQMAPDPDAAEELRRRLSSDTFEPLLEELRQSLSRPAHVELVEATFFSLAHADNPIVDDIFERLDPTSPVLAIPFGVPYRLIYDAPDHWGEKPMQFVERVLAEHPDGDFKASVLGVLVQTAILAGDQETADRRMDQLLAAYPESKAVEVTRQLVGDASAVPVGSQMPSFSVAALLDPERRYSDQDFQGKPLLVDFWATWCAPCIGEIPSLQEAYRRYSPAGFQLLSVTLDSDLEKAAGYVRDRFEMPWEHGAGENAMVSEIAQAFGVRFLPTPVLFDGNGTVVARGIQLVGEDNLERELAALFPEPAPGP